MNHSLSQNKITEFLDLNLSKNSSKKFIRNMNDSKEKKLYKLPSLTILKRVQSAGPNDLKLPDLKNVLSINKLVYKTEASLKTIKNKLTLTKDKLKTTNSKVISPIGKPPMYKINTNVNIDCSMDEILNSSIMTKKTLIVNEMIPYEEVNDVKINTISPQNKKMSIKLKKPPKITTLCAEENKISKILNTRQPKNIEYNKNNNSSPTTTTFPTINTSCRIDDKIIISNLYYKDIEHPLIQYTSHIDKVRMKKFVKEIGKITMIRSISPTRYSSKLKDNKEKNEDIKKFLHKLPKYNYGSVNLLK